MIIELEIIEQIAEESNGRSMEWLLLFIRRVDSRDPLMVLAGMWKGGYLEFRDLDQIPLPAWKVEQAFRTQAFQDSEHVHATEQGLSWAYGDEA